MTHVRLRYQAQDNTLRLTLDDDRAQPAQCRQVEGLIDIAELGRLVGIEFQSDAFALDEVLDSWVKDPVAGRYIEIEGSRAFLALNTPDEDVASIHVRSAAINISVEFDVDGRLIALAIPRRGAGYEISFPSGNR